MLHNGIVDFFELERKEQIEESNEVWNANEIACANSSEREGAIDLSQINSRAKTELQWK